MKENIDKTVVASDDTISIIKQPNIDTLILEEQEMDTALDSLYDFNEDDGFEEDFSDQLLDKIRAKLIDANIQFQADETPIESDRKRSVSFREKLVDVVMCTPPDSPDFSEDEEINEKSLEEIQTASQRPSSEHYEEDIYNFDDEFVPLYCENSKLEDITEDNESNLEDNADEGEQVNQLKLNSNDDDYENNDLESDNDTKREESQLNEENVVESNNFQIEENNNNEEERDSLNSEDKSELNDKNENDSQHEEDKLNNANNSLSHNNDDEAKELQLNNMHSSDDDDDHQKKELEEEDFTQETLNLQEKDEFEVAEVENTSIKLDAGDKNDDFSECKSDDDDDCEVDYDYSDEDHEDIKENNLATILLQHLNVNSTSSDDKSSEEQRVEVIEESQSTVSVLDSMSALKKEIKSCPNNAQNKHSKSTEDILNLKRYDPLTNSTLPFKNFEGTASVLPKLPKPSNTKADSSKTKQIGKQSLKKLPNYKGNQRSQYGLSQEELDELRNKKKEKVLREKMKEMKIEEDKLQRKRESEQAYEAWLSRKKSAGKTKSADSSKVNNDQPESKKDSKEADKAFRTWLEKKEEQLYIDKIISQLQKEEATSDNRKKLDSSKAFKRWLRNKQRERQESKSTSRPVNYSNTLPLSARHLEMFAQKFYAYLGNDM